MTAQSVLFSWCAVLLAGAGGYWYYTRQPPGRRGDHPRKGSGAGVECSSRRFTDGKPRRGHEKGAAAQGMELSAHDRSLSPQLGSSRDASRNSQMTRRRNNTGQGVSESPSRYKVPRVDGNVEESPRLEKDEAGASVSNTEMARAMRAHAAGTKFETLAKEKDKVRTVKQSKMNKRTQAAVSGNVTASSGTTAEADEESTSLSTNSPVPEAVTPPIDSTGVADMLEPPVPVAQVLRLTGTEQDKPSQQRPVSKSLSQEPLSKKQRQRRAKAEAQKAERAEVEKDRAQKLEKQRRTAREAEGRAARTGGGWTFDSGKPAPTAGMGSSEQTGHSLSSFGGAPPPHPSQPKVNGVLATQGDVVASASTQQSENSQRISTIATPNDQENLPPQSSRAFADWEKGLPTEEMQMKLLQAQQDADQWTTVANKKSSRKAKVPAADDDSST